MPKRYAVSPLSTFQPGMTIGGHRAAFLVDTVPPNLNQSGRKLTLNTQSPRSVHVQGAGNFANIDFAAHDFIYTTGLYQCMAVCAVWNKAGDVFTRGYLAHVSSPHGAVIAQSVPAAPADAFIVVDVGPGPWTQAVAQALCANGRRPDNNVWIYVREGPGDTGFGIDRHGRFGEV